MSLFTSSGFGLGLVILVLVLVLIIWSCLHHCQCWWGLLPPPQKPHPALGLRPRFFGPLGLIRQPLPTVFLSSMHRVLTKNTDIVHFRSQSMHQNAGFCIKNIQKKSGGRDPRTPRRNGGHLFAPTPVTTCQMLVPLGIF